METANLLISHSMSTMIVKKVSVTVTNVTNTTESPILMRQNTLIASFAVVTPEQPKYVKPVDTAILGLISEDDPDLTTYLNERLRTKKLEQQNNTFWLPTPESFGRPEDHTPIQTRILKEIIELEQKETLNPQDDTES